jgi:hypothetical protein
MSHHIRSVLLALGASSAVALALGVIGQVASTPLARVNGSDTFAYLTWVLSAGAGVVVIWKRFGRRALPMALVYVPLWIVLLVSFGLMFAGYFYDDHL